MTLTKKAYKKYRRDGLLDLSGSFKRFLVQKATQPAVPIIYNNTSHIRYSDMVNNHANQKILKLDSNTLNRNYNVEIPFYLDQNSRYFRNLPRYSFNNQYVLEFENVRLVGPDAVPVTADGSIIAEAIEPALEEGYRLKQALHRLLYNRSGIKSYMSGAEQEFDCVCSLVTSWNNYYHWTIEHLPKLRAIEAASNAWDVDPTLLIPEDPPSYIIESLELMGYNVGDCVEWKGGMINAEKYIQPTFTEPSKNICDWLQKRALSNINESKYSDKKRIYISRKKTSSRSVKNERHLESVLSKFGFETYTVEDLTFSQQVGLFENASIIIGPHGAGLTNIIWAKNTTVIELFNKIVKRPYFQIANGLNFEYYPIQAASVDSHQINSNMVIDVDDIKKILQLKIGQ